MNPTPVLSIDRPFARIGRALAPGLLAGLITGVVYGFLFPIAYSYTLHILLSAALGIVYGTVAGQYSHSFGTGFIKGQAFGLSWWLLGPLTFIPLLHGQTLPWTVDEVDLIFSELLRQVIGFGAVLGLTHHLLYHWFNRLRTSQITTQAISRSKPKMPVSQEIVPPLVQSLLIGGFSGVIGSWVFAWGIDRASFYPLVAGLIGSDSAASGRLLHYTIGSIIGTSFGLLFQRDVRQPGPGLILGLSYGLFWWVLGPLTLMPFLLGVQGLPDWSLGAGRQVFASLISHMLYGALVGYLSGLATRLWEVLFVESDPLNRVREGAGTRGVRNISHGLAGGIIGGSLFTGMMVLVGALPAVAQLVGTRSWLVGLMVHLVISMIVGIGFGLLFEKNLSSYGAGLGWGTVYGLFWWVWGALTLYPILLRQTPEWRLPVVAAQFPSLVGHLLYGAGLGLFFYHVANRAQVNKRGITTPELPPDTSNRQSHTFAPALWVVTLLLGILLPMLLNIQ